MGRKKCCYIGCGSTSGEVAFFMFPVTSWEQLSLWLLHSGNIHLKFEVLHRKFICSDHFPPSAIKETDLGKKILHINAVPIKCLAYEPEGLKPIKFLESRKEAYLSWWNGNSFCMEKEMFKTLPLAWTRWKADTLELVRLRLKNQVNVYECKTADTTQADSKLNTKSNPNMDLPRTTHTIVIPENIHPNNVKEEPGHKRKLLNNVNTIDGIAQTLSKNIKAEEIIADLPVKIEPMDIMDIKTENECEAEAIPNKLEIEFEIEFTNDPNDSGIVCSMPGSKNNVNIPSATIKEEPVDMNEIKLEIECDSDIKCESEVECDSDIQGFSQDNRQVNDSDIKEIVLNNDVPSTQDKTILTEVFIKNEYSSENYLQNSQIIDEHTDTPAAVANILAEWNDNSESDIECASESIECDSEPNECDSESIECGSELVECASDTTNMPEVKLTNDAAKRKWFICAVVKSKKAESAVTAHITEPIPRKEPFLRKEPQKPRMVQSKPFQCSECQMRFKYEFILMAHIKEHSGKNFKCDICNRQCKTKRSLEKHLNSHTRERLFSCPTCQHNFTERSNLLNHLLKHTPNETFPCSRCNETFSNAIDLKRHSSAHRKYFPCKLCDEKFNSEADLDGHTKRHIKFLECTFCLKQFKDAEKLRKHTMTHKDMLEKVQGSSHSCQHCGKRFLYLSTLLSHEKIHSEEKPYSCEECPQRFRTSSARNEHVRGHRLLFKCEECGKSFARQSTLERHQRLHTGEKPYSCHLCDRSFAQQVALNYHLKRFHGELKAKLTTSTKKPEKTGQVTDITKASNK